MTSGIFLELISKFGMFIYRLFANSFIYKMLKAVETFFSNAINGGAIVGGLTKQRGFYKSSLIYKLFAAPFNWFSAISRKIGDAFAQKLEQSRILTFLNTILTGALMLNSRFIGAFLTQFSLAAIIVKIFVFHTAVPVYLLAAFILGVVLLIFDVNFMNYLASSGTVEFFKTCLGLDFDYSEQTPRGSYIISGLILGLGCGAVFAWSMLYGLLAFAGIMGITLMFKYPKTAVFITVAAAPFVGTMILGGLCIVSMASLLISSFTKKDFKWRIDSTGFWLLIFLAVLGFSTFTSFARGQSVMVFARYFVFLLFFIVIVNTLKTKKDIQNLLKIFVICGFFVALYGIAQYLFGFGVTQNAWLDKEMFAGQVRIYSTLENPNVLGEYLILAATLCLPFIFKRTTHAFQRIAYSGMLGVMLVALLLTQSRGCYLGIIFAFMIFVSFSNGKLWVLAPLAFIGLLYVIPQSYIDRFMSIGNLNDSSSTYRLFIWLGTMGMLKDYWIFGIGLGEGAYNSIYPFYSFNSVIAPHSHNLYLQILTECGIVGIAAFLGFLLSVCKRLINVCKDEKTDRFDYLIILGFIAAAGGFLLQSFFDYTFYNYRVMAMFIMLCGILCAYSHADGAEND